MPELANCESCGKVFVKVTTELCPTCRKENEKKFETVYKFIRQKENRESTVMEVHEATGVEEKLIFQWIKEGRLKVKDFKNLTYPCKNCGVPIQAGTFCVNCTEQFKREVENLEKEEQFTNAKTRTYHIR